MKAVVVKSNQVGAVLSLELAILMAVAASIAIALGIILGGRLPWIFNNMLDNIAYAAQSTTAANEELGCTIVSTVYDNQYGGGNLLQLVNGKTVGNPAYYTELNTICNNPALGSGTYGIPQ